MNRPAAAILVALVAILGTLRSLSAQSPSPKPPKTTIKGIHPDYRSVPEVDASGGRPRAHVIDSVAGNESGWVAIPIVWRELVGDDATSDHDRHRSSEANCDSSTPPGDTANELYAATFVNDGVTRTVQECFRYGALEPIDRAVDRFHAEGVRMIGILTDVPGFARWENCTEDGNTDPGALARCAPSWYQDPNLDSGVVLLHVATRYLAKRYRGRIGHWVVLNEVNHADHFRMSCGNCSSSEYRRVAWIDHYVRVFRHAYDGILEGHGEVALGGPYAPEPEVFVPLTGLFDVPWDVATTEGGLSLAPALGGRTRSISVKTFLGRFDSVLNADLAPGVPPRTWRLAQHVYPRDIFMPIVTADDLTEPRRITTAPYEKREFYADEFDSSPPPGLRGFVTPATIGAVVGWLRAEQANGNLRNLKTWKIFMTEGGINSRSESHASLYADKYFAPGTRADGFRVLQSHRICEAFESYLGTPGIDAVLLQRLIDAADEGGLELGVWETDLDPKPAWPTYALANRPGHLSCGFESLPYVRIRRARAPAQQHRHRISSRPLPPDYSVATGGVLEREWYLLRDERPATRLLYECWLPSGTTDVGGRTFASTRPDCDGRRDAQSRPALNLGPLGFAFTSHPGHGTWYEIFNCTITDDDIVTDDPHCEGQGPRPIVSLGWVSPSPEFHSSATVTLKRYCSGCTPEDPYRGPHWDTAVVPPPGFTVPFYSRGWEILREPAANTKLYWECLWGNHTFPSEREDCEQPAAKNLGPLGYLRQEPAEGDVPLYRCRFGNGEDHMIADYDCPPGWTREGDRPIGHARRVN